MRPASAECKRRLIGESAAMADDVKAMAAAAWHKLGIATINIADVFDPFEKQAIINAANRIYGRRKSE